MLGMCHSEAFDLAEVWFCTAYVQRSIELVGSLVDYRFVLTLP